MSDSQGPFKLIEKRPGRPTAFKITATSLLYMRSDVIIVGTSDGQVLLPQGPDKKEDSIVTVLKARKPVTRLIKSSSDTFLAVCGGELFLLSAKTFSRKPAFQTLRQVADVCALEKENGGLNICVLMSSSIIPGAPSPSSQPMASSASSPLPEDGVLQFYNMNRGQVEKIRETAIKDVVGRPIQVCWCSPSVVCVGGTRSAVLIDVKGALKKIPIVVDAKKGPRILKLREDRVLLSSAGGIGVVVDLNGFPCPNVGAIVWSASPVALVCSGPYVICLSEDGCVEIALLESPGSILQTFTLPGCSEAINADISFNDESMIHPDDVGFSFLVGLTSQHSDLPFRRFESLPFRERIKSLLIADGGDCSRALSLVRDSFSEVRKRQEKENLVYLQAAAVLMERKVDLDKAFTLLSIGKIDTARLLALCGYVVSEEDEFAIQSEDEGVQVIKRVIEEGGLFEDPHFRSQIQDHVLRMRSSESTARLDTAILFLLADIGTDKVLESFCKDRTNKCDLELCERRLEALGHELASALLRSARSDKLSLKTMEKFKELNRPDLVADTLASLNLPEQDTNELRSFTMHFLEWLVTNLEQEKVKDLLKLLAGYIDNLEPLEHSSIPRKHFLISSILLAKRDDFAQTIDRVVLASHLVHALEEVIIVEEKKDASLSRSLESLVRSDKEAAQTSLELLSASRYKSRMGKERAACLGSLGRHMEALRIYVGELNDYELAERYCEEYQSDGIGSADAAGTQIDPFTALLTIHLERFASSTSTGKDSSSGGARAEAAIGFLSRHASRVNSLEAVTVLPESLSLSTAMAFLERAILKVSTEKRANRVEKNLARAENLGVKLKLVQLQKQYSVVTEEMVCVKCMQKIGVELPVVRHSATGVLYHAQCPMKKFFQQGQQ